MEKQTNFICSPRQNIKRFRKDSRPFELESYPMIGLLKSNFLIHYHATLHCYIDLSRLTSVACLIRHKTSLDVGKNSFSSIGHPAGLI